MANAISPLQGPAQSLLGLELEGGWTVIERLENDAGATGGTFSAGYVVEKPTGERAFLKALDYSDALYAVDAARALEQLTAAFNFERDILRTCSALRLDHISTAITDGSVLVPNCGAVGRVQYLIFDLADSDVRRIITFSAQLEVAWALRVLHQVAVGIGQLHKNGMAHQDIKPSNVLHFGALSKLGDMGSAAQQGASPPHEDEICAGDVAYATPESQYGYKHPEWNVRRQATDLYHMGSLALFLFAGVSMTAALCDKIEQRNALHSYKGWRGLYDDVLPYVIDAYDEVIQETTVDLPERYRADLTKLITELCYPDPLSRGDPICRKPGWSNPYDVQRYISRFNRLAIQAESSMKALYIDKTIR